MTEKKFVPKPGQIDFTNARYAPTFNAVLTDGQKILMIKRSNKVGFYPGTWNGVSGFLDDNQKIEDKFAEELEEELGLSKAAIKSIKVGRPFLQDAPDYGKVWVVLPMLVSLKPGKFRLNWEADEAKWLRLAEIKKMELMPGFDQVIREFFQI